MGARGRSTIQVTAAAHPAQQVGVAWVGAASRIGYAAALEAYYEDHDSASKAAGRSPMLLRRLWTEHHGQDIAEYAVMLAVILVLVVGTIRLVGSNANNAFSAVASSIQ